MIRRVLVALIMVCASAQAELWMPSIFSDGMVLQADKPVPIWGEAAAGALAASHVDQGVVVQRSRSGTKRVEQLVCGTKAPDPRVHRVRVFYFCGNVAHANVLIGLPKYTYHLRFHTWKLND